MIKVYEYNDPKGFIIQVWALLDALQYGRTGPAIGIFSEYLFEGFISFEDIFDIVEGDDVIVNSSVDDDFRVVPFEAIRAALEVFQEKGFMNLF